MMISPHKIIMCIADAPGPAEFLAPVIELLTKDAHVIIIAVGTAMNILKPLGAIACDDEMQAGNIFAQIKPDMLVSAISSLTNGPYVNNRFIKLAHENKIPIISLQDIWGNHRMAQNKEITSSVNAVCVPDEFAGSLWKEDGFQGKIFVTGNPAFDRFATLDVPAERNRLREQLHINQSDHVIVYAGQGTPLHIEADKKTFAYVTQAIRELAIDMPIKLIARHHPRAIETAYYNEYSHGIETIDTSSFAFADDILPSTDVVVAMFSTSLLHACCLRIPAISVLLPEQGRASLKKIGLDDFPSNVMGATAGVYDKNPAVLAQTFEKVFTDSSFCSRMRERQEKNFPLDGGSANRVAKIIKKIMRNEMPPE